MIDVAKELIHYMKEEKNDLNSAVLQVLREIKTKSKDITTEITDEVQMKMLKKMKADRLKSYNIYIENNRNDLAQKESDEMKAIDLLSEQINLPKEMSEDEIKEVLNKIKEREGYLEMRVVMTIFKTMNADKGLVAKLVKEMNG